MYLNYKKALKKTIVDEPFAAGIRLNMNDIWNTVRSSIIGSSVDIEAPYGNRPLLYADYTASGRGVVFVERYMQKILETYANTHTEDDLTGLRMSERLHAAEKLIKKHLHATDDYMIVSNGAGATAAINRLQEILGIYVPPATRERIESFRNSELLPQEELPLVLVGPYEHHSNEISWREGLAEVIEIQLDEKGYLDLDDLREKVGDPAYRNRMKIGSFSAASNVSGIKTDVFAVAEILHEAGALAFFDYSASAPYVDISVYRSETDYLDGIFFSPHKFLGGPGSAGILVLRKELYRDDLPPSESGGGTVSFVDAITQDYVVDLEEREKAGTPGILQTLRAALAVDLKERIGIDAIEERERELFSRAQKRFSRSEQIEVIGDAPPEDRLSIFSFNVHMKDGYLHPRFVVRLLNDLFGIQSRAGCSCAGPYGHRLLEIDVRKSEIYRQYIHRGINGLKPGWVRLNFHYLMTDREFEYICRSLEIVSQFGLYYLSEYTFDLDSGAWVHRDQGTDTEVFSVEEALRMNDEAPSVQEEDVDFEAYLRFAEEHGRDLEKEFQWKELQGTTEELIPFLFVEETKSM